ncbi:hypothetical protein BO70DRAFT_363109 [Aspergillus heteromorphus CBS 117.55]|uniref:Uncharacterized protein n=1 Tax=Aspergillus heteromorphus CBS 117.55 TaxID=1448321 RepID=A0A317VZ60_9EURO|nr:uncharacterized protein BO70DRAFT_363109 [Aspergillus heteromorphus CBS 117.55]PWY78218.1 hypothetical protein BO70DRAFT_363109 [Aspergillus heteromorphus CBS 117.55]
MSKEMSVEKSIGLLGHCIGIFYTVPSTMVKYFGSVMIDINEVYIVGVMSVPYDIMFQICWVHDDTMDVSVV